MAVVLRAASGSDADAVADAFLRTRAEAHRRGLIPPVADEADARAWLHRLVGAGGVSVAFDERAGVLGMSAVSPGWLEQLYVRPEAAGRGIGHALLERAKAGATDGLQLWTFQANAPARRFYARRGFVEVEFTDGSNTMEKAPDVRLTWTPAPTAAPTPGLAPAPATTAAVVTPPSRTNG